MSNLSFPETGEKPSARCPRCDYPITDYGNNWSTCSECGEDCTNYNKNILIWSLLPIVALIVSVMGALWVLLVPPSGSLWEPLHSQRVLLAENAQLVSIVPAYPSDLIRGVMLDRPIMSIASVVIFLLALVIMLVDYIPKNRIRQCFRQYCYAASCGLGLGKLLWMSMAVFQILGFFILTCQITILLLLII